MVPSILTSALQGAERSDARPSLFNPLHRRYGRPKSPAGQSGKKDFCICRKSNTGRPAQSRPLDWWRYPASICCRIKINYFICGLIRKCRPLTCVHLEVPPHTPLLVLPFISKCRFTLNVTSNMVTMQSLPDAHLRGHKSVMNFQKALLLLQIPIVHNVLLLRCHYHGCFSVRLSAFCFVVFISHNLLPMCHVLAVVNINITVGYETSYSLAGRRKRGGGTCYLQIH